MSCPNSFP